MLRSFRQSQIENTYKLKMQISNVRSSMPIGDKDINQNGEFAMEDNDHSNAEMHKKVLWSDHARDDSKS